MFSLFSMFNKKVEAKDEKLNSIYPKLRDLYDIESIPEERKKYLKEKIQNFGYLPYSYQQALDELTPSEILYGLEIKWSLNNIFDSKIFSFKNIEISPAARNGYKNSDWIKKEQHNIKLINLAGLGDGNKTEETGKFIDWLRQVLILPAGKTEKGILSTTIYLIPFHPREFGCAYLPTSTDVSPNLEDKKLTEILGLDTKAQVKLFIELAQLAGHPVIYDVLPQTGRFSKMVLANPSIARWFDVNTLIEKIEKAVDEAVVELKKEFQSDDVDIVSDIYKKTLKSGSCDLSEHYQVIYNALDKILEPKKKEFSNKMLTKREQNKLHKKAKKVVANMLQKHTWQIKKEEDITNQGGVISTLIKLGLWPAPGGAWCSSGIPVFEKMSEHGDYPEFKHYDFKCEDVTHFANLDCQTPYYFVYLENGKYNKKAINAYIDYLKNLQETYNFDGFRVDHIDHIVDEVSEKDGVPISYRAPRKVLGKANEVMKKKIPHFAALAEYMLWNKYYNEYHKDMNFDILWGNDIISQCSKNPEEIMNNNHELGEYNMKTPKTPNLSILKTYNNQDGEFRDIDQYPGQLGKEGALFKWFKYKFLPGGKNAQRPVLFIDGDESFTKTGIESVIGNEVSMKRANNPEFFKKFDAILRFALNSELTREGEAEIMQQDDDGYVVWLVSKDPLKEALLVLGNYNPPTQKVSEYGEDGYCNVYIKEGEPVYNKSVKLPCDYQLVAEYAYNEEEGDFEEVKFASPETEMTFDKLEPSQFKIFKLLK